MAKWKVTYTEKTGPAQSTKETIEADSYELGNPEGWLVFYRNEHLR